MKVGDAHNTQQFAEQQLENLRIISSGRRARKTFVKEEMRKVEENANKIPEGTAWKVFSVAMDAILSVANFFRLIILGSLMGIPFLENLTGKLT
ncbi:MAG: hypothetical protein COT84_05655 [Chlamydiae bacterium CG10_big_fil_rev_8_21_14_0_10_35_9]|nr:MAG: hypothetical protein COT84_05655 [Chlamydiae bacterium CG10_big_fil_rev_8_21_14_0_10_35_9]